MIFQWGTIVLGNVKQISIPRRFIQSGIVQVIVLMFEADSDHVRDHKENQSD